MEMVDSVKKTVLRHNMFYEVENVTVALSGGADSVALLSVMRELSKEFGFTVYAAHLNHCLRGQESDRDEEFVRLLCESWGVRLFCEKADVKGFADANGLSIELAARRVRYEFLERVGVGVIATAHTASDNIETFLHNAVRGSGLRGITGIPPKRGRFIRPFLDVTREDVEQYCAEKGLAFCVDSTNADEQYTRNFIRHSVVPGLKKVNSSAVLNVANLCESLRQDADFIESAVDEAYRSVQSNGGLDVEKLKALHQSLRSRVIARCYEAAVGTVPERIHINAIIELLEGPSGRVGVQRNFAAEIKHGVLQFNLLKNDRELVETEVSDFPFVYNGVELSLENAKSFREKAKFNSLLLNFAIDYDKICDKLILRGRKPGDKINLKGRNCTKTFKNLFNEEGLGLATRDSLVVAADSVGVLWLQGFGVDQRVAVDDTTENVLCFKSIMFRKGV